MTTPTDRELIEAIERYEAAIDPDVHATSIQITQAEAELLPLLGNCAPDHDDVCAPLCEGCCEGVEHRGVVYAAFSGFTRDEKSPPCCHLIRIPRVRSVVASARTLPMPSLN